MDAVVPQGVRHLAYGQAVWSRPPDAGDKLVAMIRNGRRRLTSPVLRGDHGAAVNHCAGSAVRFRPCLTTCGHSSFSAHEDCGCGRAPGIPCALTSERDTICNSSGGNPAARTRSHESNQEMIVCERSPRKLVPPLSRGKAASYPASGAGHNDSRRNPGIASFRERGLAWLMERQSEGGHPAGSVRLRVHHCLETSLSDAGL
jgi:hypothetical protein